MPETGRPSPRRPESDRPAAEDLRRIAQRAGQELARLLETPLRPGLYLVATPIGHLGDVTLRAVATLSRADVICCEDTRHSLRLLDRYGISRPLRSYHDQNADAERPKVLASLAAGKAVALVSDAGTPLVSDPGYKLVREALAAGHRVESLPGPSAVLAGLASSGLPTDSFTFAGFLPPKSVGRRRRLGELARAPGTLVLFEAPGRLAESLADMADILGDRQAAIARELTKLHEELRRGSLSELAAWAGGDAVRGEIVVLVAPAEEVAAGVGEIEAALRQALARASLRDAVREVAEALGAPRKQVYDLAIALARAVGDGEEPR